MSAAKLHTVKLEKGELVFDANLTVGQVRKMANSEGDIDAVIMVLGSVITEWPYEGDPSDPESWDNLHMDEFQEVAETLTEALGNVLSE